MLFPSVITCFVPLNSEHTQVKTKQASPKTAPVLTSDEVNLRFLQLRSEFRKIGIDNPNPFIRWKRPDLSDKDETRIMLGLTGRGNSKSAYLLPVVEDVLQQLTAA